MALDQFSIVSLGDARLFLGKSDTDTADDQLIDLHIQTASSMVARELGVEGVVSRAYREFHDGHGGCNLLLNNYPVTSVDFVSTGRSGALTIEYTDGDASYATVEVTLTELKLRKRVSGVLTASAFTLADYATLMALETAVEAVSGWTVIVETDYATYAPISLVPVPAKDAADAEVTLEVPYEGEIACELSSAWGRLYNPYGWTRGHKNILIEYTAGYARGEVPAPIRGACLELVKLMYDLSKKDGGLKKETIGEYSYEVAANVDLTESSLIAEKLVNYRRTVVMGA